MLILNDLNIVFPELKSLNLFSSSREYPVVPVTRATLLSSSFIFFNNSIVAEGTVKSIITLLFAIKFLMLSVTIILDIFFPTNGCPSFHIKQLIQ